MTARLRPGSPSTTGAPLAGEPICATLLAELRCASARARLAAVEIDAVGVMLRHKLIDAFAALAMLRDADALKFLDLAGAADIGISRKDIHDARAYRDKGAA